MAKKTPWFLFLQKIKNRKFYQKNKNFDIHSNKDVIKLESGNAVERGIIFYET